MERAPLRPVPARTAGPVDPAAAVREIATALPGLEPLKVRALALVALAERPRAEVAGLLAVDEAELCWMLAAARKELRQTITPLSGSGWCERAEGLISDRLDGVVAEPDDRRLDVHLRNCARCVEHERRLVQATDALLAGIAPARPSPAPASDAALTAVTPGAEAPAGGAPGDARPAELAPGDAPAALSPGEAPAEIPSGEAPADLAPGDAPPVDAEPADLEVAALERDASTEPTSVAAESGAAAAELVGAGEPPAPSSDQIAAAAEVLVTARTRRQLAAAITWNALIAIAVMLTIASIVLIVAGALGAEL